MISPGSRRGRLFAALATAYSDGLLSDATLSLRSDALLGSRVIEPERLVGDLTVDRRDTVDGRTARIRATLAGWVNGVRSRHDGPECPVLALDWSGQTAELTIGRDPGCDIVLELPTVSRRHAVLRFRDGWILQDLGSRNGTSVNRRRVTRCRLMAGDRIVLGGQPLVVD